MLFNSVTFLFFFLPAAILLYVCIQILPIKRKIPYQNLLLILLSLLFFEWADNGSIPVLLALILLNYVAALLSQISKKFLLLGVVCNIGVLFYFKYLNTIFVWLSQLGLGSMALSDIISPLGISFIIFHNISYLLDIYWGKAPINKNILEIALYIVFFPKLIQGPIVKYHDFHSDLKIRHWNFSNFVDGVERFILGLSKKVLVADIIALTVADIFERTYTGIDVPTAWLGSILYTLQIYIDFSGYSDMAIGLGKMFGFHLTENFNFPYSSLSITEFWRRWHISLGAWFREYLYFPLGGSRKGNVYFNLMIVFLVTGIWHGSAIVFPLWGIAHGICVVVERYAFSKPWYQKIPKTVKWLGTMFIVNIGWIVFRTGNLDMFKTYLKNMLGLNSYPVAFQFSYYFTGRIIFLICLSIFCMVVFSRPQVQNKLAVWNQNSKIFGTVKYTGLCLLLILSIFATVSSSYSPFIYFQF